MDAGHEVTILINQNISPFCNTYFISASLLVAVTPNAEKALPIESPTLVNSSDVFLTLKYNIMKLP